MFSKSILIAGLVSIFFLLSEFSQEKREMEQTLSPPSNVSRPFQTLSYIDRTGKVAIDASEYTQAFSFASGLAAVSNGFRYGFIDKSGRIAIVPKFFQAASFSEGLAAVKLQEKQFSNPSGKNVWGYINLDGKIVIQGEFDEAYDFAEGVAVIKEGNIYSFIDKTGRKLVSMDSAEIQLGYQENPKFSEGFIAACNVPTGKHGFLDKTGKFVIEPKFQNVANFSEGLARASVKVNNREYLGFIDLKGNFMIPPKFDIDSDFQRSAYDFSEGLASLISAPAMTDFVYIDRSGKIVLRTSYFYAGAFKDGLAIVYDNKTDKRGFINKSGELVIPLVYSDAKAFSEGLSLVRSRFINP